MDSFYEQNTSMSMEPPVISLAPDYSQYREPDGL